MFKCSKCHFEIKRRLENCGAMQMETMNITAKIQPTTCVLTLFSANADVKIPLFLNVKIVQAYSDTSFLWRGFEITKPSVCCHLLLLWKWICQVSWKQVSNKPLLWKIMYNFCWWCHPSITVHLPPRSSQLVPVSSVGKALSFSTRISAAYAHLPLVVGLLGTHGCALDATHTHFHVALSPPWHRGDTWAHLHSNPACKGQVTPSSCPSEDSLPLPLADWSLPSWGRSERQTEKPELAWDLPFFLSIYSCVLRDELQCQLCSWGCPQDRDSACVR